MSDFLYMPRVTFEMYWQQHLALKSTWDNAPGNFSKLPPKDQWQLHEYFLFADALTREQLNGHWLELKKDANSSKHHCAGRAYAAMKPYLVTSPVKMAPAPARKRRRGKREKSVLRLEGLVRPEPDVEKFVKVLMDIAKEAQR